MTGQESTDQDNAVPGMGNLLSCWSEESEIHKIIQTTAVALGCLLELKGKILLLKTPHTRGESSQN